MGTNDGAPEPFTFASLPPHRQVSKEEGAQLAAEYGIQFFETSAKEDKNVEKGFITIAREVKDRLMQDTSRGGANNKDHIDLGPAKKGGTKSACCS